MTGRSLQRRLAFPAACLAVVLAHLALTFYWERVEIIFSDQPHGWLDYDTHVEQVWRAAEALDRWGRSWSYDPHLLAGMPNGTIFEADNKGWEIWSFALWKLGLPLGTAFNLFILLAHLLMPVVVFASARLFRLDRWAALVAAVLGICVWYFDSLTHWLWWCGMTAYAIAGYLSVLCVALYYRCLRDGRWYFFVLLAIAMAAAHLAHPYAFFMLVFPLGAFYLASFRRLGLGRHLGSFGVAAAVVLANAYWLVPSLRHLRYMIVIESGVYCQSTISFLLTDYLGLLKEPVATGVLVSRTGFRFLALGAAVVGLWLWRRDRDDRFWPLAVGSGALLAITYLGGYSSFFTHVQPYRHVHPAIYMAIIPAAFFLRRVWADGAFANLTGPACAGIALLSIAVIGNLSRDVLYFFPELAPKTRLQAEDEMALKETNPNVVGIMRRPMSFRHTPVFPDFNRVAEWVRQHDDGSGRFLVENWILGEHLAWRTDAGILGGFRLRNIQQSASNLFRRFDEGRVSEEQARRHLEDFAVKWVIISGPNSGLEKYKSLLRPVWIIPPVHRIYETTVPVSFFARGSGRIRPSLNRLEVNGTDPSTDLVLRYHWLDSLRCRPGCRVEQEPLPYDQVGLIRIPAPHPADFVVENVY